MKAADIISKARFEIRDKRKEAYSDEELLIYLNDAVAFIDTVLANYNIPLQKKRIRAEGENIPLPDDFIRLERNINGVNVFRNEIIINKELLPLDLVYISGSEQLETIEDMITYPAYFESAIRQMVISKALNRNEYNINIEEMWTGKYTAQIIRLAKSAGGLLINADKKMKYEV